MKNQCNHFGSNLILLSNSGVDKNNNITDLSETFSEKYISFVTSNPEGKIFEKGKCKCGRIIGQYILCSSILTFFLKRNMSHIEGEGWKN